MFIKHNLIFGLFLGWPAILNSSAILLKYSTFEAGFIMSPRIKQIHTRFEFLYIVASAKNEKVRKLKKDLLSNVLFGSKLGC